MELVYLWIEKYKNIKRQGFTFSPRFDCEFKPKYNENDELIPDESELIIEEKKDYVNIFPDNINITAIVGKNGAGKSNVLEAFYEYLYEKGKNNKNNLFIIYTDKKNNYYSLGMEIKKCNITDIKNQHKEDFYKKFYSMFFDFTIFHSINNDKDNHKQDFAVEPSRTFKTGNQRSKIEPVSIHGNLQIKSLFFYYLINTTNNEKLLTYLNLPQFKKIILKITPGKFKRDYETIKKILNAGENSEFLTEEKKLLKDINLQIIQNMTINNYENINNYLIAFFENYLKKREKNEIVFEFDKTILNERSFLILFEYLDALFTFDLYFKTTYGDIISYRNLSTGQKLILSYFGIVSLNKILFANERELLIYFDEFETSFHPDYQRIFLKNFIYMLKNLFGKNLFHLFFLTHSPFILSDIPKENIIFMKEGKNVSDEVDIKTFGANIHTLLTHGFFMEDGLMGEYAKEKIHQTIKLLNEPKLTNKEIEFCEKIISIIGEPIIKKQLQRMLDSKRLKKIDKIDELEKEIELIKARIEILRKNS